MRLRSYISILFILVASVAVIGTAYFASRRFSEQQKSYLIELSSLTAPALASQASVFFSNLNEQIDDLNRRFNSKDSVKPEDLQKSFERISHARQILIRDEKGLLAEWVASEGLRVPSSATCHERLERLGELAVWCRSLGKRTYLVALDPNFLRSDSYVLHALKTGIVNAKGSLILGNVSVDDPLPWRALANLQSASVASREVGRELIALSPIAALEGYFAVVETETSHLGEMLGEALSSLAPFFIVMGFSVALLGIWFASRIARPIEILTGATSKIAEGVWRTALPPLPGREIAQLGRAFTRMGEELERRERDLKKAHIELIRSEKLAALGRFSATIAHEVKNPLNNVLGYAQLLTRSHQGSEHEYAEHIVQETRRANGILSELLVFARQKAPRRESISLGALAEQSLNAFRLRAEKSRIRCEMDMAPEQNTRTTADPEQIRRVLDNLIGNALDELEAHPPATGGRLQLRVRSEKSHFIIEVADNGRGVREEDRDHIFDPFFSTKDLGKGTGLGLAICQSIVEQHGGKIQLESERPTGSCFRILLPKDS